MKVSLNLNGEPKSSEVEARTLLVDFLRESCGKTGTHVGCDTSQCGACVVHLNGRSVKSCSVLAVQAQGAEVTTIEGLASEGNLHPMQEAFREHHGLQCGFCTPGMVMAVTAMLEKNPNPTSADINAQISNICRCGTYQLVRSAIKQAAKELQHG